jgi:gliding motility-associated lipoprotein GldB
MIKKKLMYFGLIVLLLNACTKNDKSKIDVSDIQLNVEIKRLDQDLFEIDPGLVEEELEPIIEKYGEFFEIYNYRVINLGSTDYIEYPDYLNGFITDYTMNAVYDKTTEVFPDLTELSEQLTDAFKHYKYYFPEKIIPEVYTYIGGFNQSIVVADSILAIGIDKYLGSDCEFYDRLGIANYLQLNMNPENIPTDAIRAWAITEFEFNDSVDNLVNNIIHHGKILYFLDKVMPECSDTLKIGFTKEEIEWCESNDEQMWNYLIDNKLLFSTDYKIINQHINPAPFTPGYPTASPGKASVWLGWQIVRAYMERNPKVTLSELMYDEDYQKILSKSRYEP